MERNNPFNNTEIASTYEEWYQSSGRIADRREKSLIKYLLEKIPNSGSILEIGCGSGHFTRWFNELGMQTVGIDLSFPMLYEAKKMDAIDLVRGDALKLPFLSRSFDLVVMITSLEFLSDPVRSLNEAFRVAKKGIMLGVLNRNSLLGWQYRKKGGPIWEKARFYTPNELKDILLKIVPGNIKISYRTTIFPFFPSHMTLPWGGFIGMVAIWDSGKDREDDRKIF